jgi:hypothetical protein
MRLCECLPAVEALQRYKGGMDHVAVDKSVGWLLVRLPWGCLVVVVGGTTQAPAGSVCCVQRIEAWGRQVEASVRHKLRGWYCCSSCESVHGGHTPPYRCWMVSC